MKILKAFFLFADSRTVLRFSLSESRFVFCVLTTWLKTVNILLTDCLKSGAAVTRESIILLKNTRNSRIMQHPGFYILHTLRGAAFGKMNQNVKLFLCINNCWLQSKTTDSSWSLIPHKHHTERERVVVSEGFRWYIFGELCGVNWCLQGAFETIRVLNIS